MARGRLSPQYAEAADVQDLIDKQWTPGMIECRAANHHWLPYTVAESKKYGYLHVKEECSSCGCKRKYDLDSRGNKLNDSSIDYVEGYLAKGIGRVTGEAKGAVRLARLKKTARVVKLRASEDLVPKSRATRDALGIKVA